MPLKAVVDLYRACGRPDLDESVFSCKADYPVVKPLLSAIINSGYARPESLIVDGSDYLDDELPRDGDCIKFSLRVSRRDSRTFHRDIKSLLSSDPKISRGEIPEEFYLVEEDYYSGDKNLNARIESLKKVCGLIQALSELAHYHDEKPSSGYLRLVFLQLDTEKFTKTIEVETKITVEILDLANHISFDLVDGLVSTTSMDDPHYSAKVGVFTTCLAAFLGNQSHQNKFEYLIRNWDQFRIDYHRDLSTYLSGFAFHKVKREIAKTEFEIAEQYSNILSDMTGKLLGLPISLGAIFALHKSESVIEQTLLFLAVLITSVILYRTVDNQTRQFQRIKKSKELVISAIEGKKEHYPDDLAKAITNLTKALRIDEVSLCRSLCIFKGLSLLPIVVTGVVIYLQYKT